MGMDSIALLPMPRKLERTTGTFSAASGRQFIQLDPDLSSDLLLAGRAIQSAAKRELSTDWRLVAGRSSVDDAVNITIVRFEHDRKQYTIDIRSNSIDIRASSPEFAFHAAQTLAQLFRQF